MEPLPLRPPDQAAATAIELMRWISEEARRLSGLDASHEALLRAEAHVRYCDYLNGVRPLVDFKARLLALCMPPRLLLLLHEDGRLELTPQEPQVPPELRESMRVVDEAIKDFALACGFPMRSTLVR